MRNLRDWQPGDNVQNNEHHQQAVLALRELDAREANGRPPPDWTPGEEWPAAIVATGPAAAADRTDERYWLKKFYVVGGVAADAQIGFNPDLGGDYDDGPNPVVVTGHNLAEIYYGTHELPTDGSVIVWCKVWFDRGDPQLKRYLFSVPGPGPVRLYLTAILSGAGAKYTVQRLPPPGADVDDSSDAVLADIGTPDGTDAIGIDTNELGRAAQSHLNSPGDVVEGRLLRTNGDGTRVYTFAVAPGPGDVFRVNVSQTGGSNGGPAAAASYTYDVLAINGETLGSAVAVAMARADGLVNAGTIGAAHYTAAGALVLDWVDEVPQTDQECPS